MVVRQLEAKLTRLETQILEDYHLGYPCNELLDYHQQLTEAIRRAKQDLEYQGPTKPKPA